MPSRLQRLLAGFLVLTALPFGLACDAGFYLFTPAQPVTSTTLTALSPSMFSPLAIDQSPDGLSFAVGDKNAHLMRLVTRNSISDDWSTATASVVAGRLSTPAFADGVGTNAGFNEPAGTDFSSDAIAMVLADKNNHAIRWVERANTSIGWDTAYVSTIAGLNSAQALVDGPVAGARFKSPYDVILSSDQTYIIVADSMNHALRLIERSSASDDWSTGTVSTISGTGTSGCDLCAGSGAAGTATWYEPKGMAMSSDEKSLFIVDSLNRRIRILKRTSTSQLWSDAIVSTIAGDGTIQILDGVGTNAQFQGPTDIALSEDELSLVITDASAQRVRYMTRASTSALWVTGSVVTVETTASLSNPVSLFISKGTLDLVVCTEAGGGLLYTIDTALPRCVADTICTPGTYFAQAASSAAATDIAGQTSPGTADGDAFTTATFNQPRYLSIDPIDGLSIAIGDQQNNRVRILTRAAISEDWRNGTVSTIGGQTSYAEGAGGAAGFGNVGSVRYSADGMRLFIVDKGGARLRMVQRALPTDGLPTLTTTTVAGDGSPGGRDGTVAGCTPGGTCPQFNSPVGLAVGANGTYVLVSDSTGHRIRMVEASGDWTTTAVVSTLNPTFAGSADGPINTATFNTPNGIVLSADELSLFVCDTNNRRIRLISRGETNGVPDAWSTATVSTIAGANAGSADGIGTNAQFQEPTDITLTSDQLTLVIADKQLGRVRLFTRASVQTAWPLGESSTITATPAFAAPSGVVIDLDAQSLIVADESQHKLKYISGVLDLCIACNVSLPAGSSFTAGCAFGENTTANPALQPATTLPSTTPNPGPNPSASTPSPLPGAPNGTNGTNVTLGPGPTPPGSQETPLSCFTQSLQLAPSLHLQVTPGERIFTLANASEWPGAANASANAFSANLTRCPPAATHCVLLLFASALGEEEQLTGACFDPLAPWAQTLSLSSSSCSDLPAGDVDIASGGGGVAYTCCQGPGCNGAPLVSTALAALTQIANPPCASEQAQDCLAYHYTDRYGCFMPEIALPPSSACARFLRPASFGCASALCASPCDCQAPSSAENAGCAQQCAALARAFPSPGCAAARIGDGVCDVLCLAAASLYDGGDCLSAPLAWRQLARHLQQADVNASGTVSFAEYASLVADAAFPPLADRAMFEAFDVRARGSGLDAVELAMLLRARDPQLQVDAIETVLLSRHPALVALEIAADLVAVGDKDQSSTLSERELDEVYGLEGVHARMLMLDDDEEEASVRGIAKVIERILRGLTGEGMPDDVDIDQTVQVFVALADHSGDGGLSPEEAARMRWGPGLFARMQTDSADEEEDRGVVTAAEILAKLFAAQTACNGFELRTRAPSALRVALPPLRTQPCKLLLQPPWFYAPPLPDATLLNGSSCLPHAPSASSLRAASDSRRSRHHRASRALLALDRSSATQGRAQQMRDVGKADAASESGEAPMVVVQVGGRECGGALVGEEWVLTAAECVGGWELEAVASGRVQIGGNATHLGGAGACVEDFAIAEVAVHPGWSGVGPGFVDLGFGVAAVKLAGKSAQVPMALYGGESDALATECTATRLEVRGWRCEHNVTAAGTTSTPAPPLNASNSSFFNASDSSLGGEGGDGRAVPGGEEACDPKRVARRAMRAEQDAELCGAVHAEWEGFRRVDAASMLCAAAAPDDDDAQNAGAGAWCGQQLGAPLVWKPRGETREVLAGVASWWGEGECGDRPTVFVRIESVRQWVLAVTGLASHPAIALAVSVTSVELPAGAMLEIYSGASEAEASKVGSFGDNCAEPGAELGDKGLGSMLVVLSLGDSAQASLVKHSVVADVERIGCSDNFGARERSGKVKEQCEEPLEGGLAGCVWGEGRCEARPCSVRLDQKRVVQLQQAGDAVLGGLGASSQRSSSQSFKRWACVRNWSEEEQRQCGVAEGEFACFRFEERSKRFVFDGLDDDLLLVPEKLKASMRERAIP